jgi:hypothetical protein
MKQVTKLAVYYKTNIRFCSSAINWDQNAILNDESRLAMTDDSRRCRVQIGDISEEPMREKAKSEKFFVCGAAVGKGALLFIAETLNGEELAMNARKIAYIYSKRSGKPNWRAKSGPNRYWDEEDLRTPGPVMLPKNLGTT